MRNKQRPLYKNSGFTLIEILVVIGIIALLTTFAMVAVRYARERAKEAKALHAIDQIALAIAMLSGDTGHWPGHQPVNQASVPADNEICGPSDAGGNGCGDSLSDGVSGLAADDAGSPYSGWTGPYMPEVADDPWGYEYFFDTDYSIDANDQPCGCGGGACTDAVVVGSYGPDGLGVPDEDAGTAGSYGCDDIIKIITK